MQAELEPLSRRYDVVVANPPYMGSSSLAKWMGAWVKKSYPEAYRDLCASFIDRGFGMSADNGYSSMVTMQSWMFLGSFEKLRGKILRNHSISSMAHLGTRAFGAIGGEVVSTTATVFANAKNQVKGAYFRLVDMGSQEEKQAGLLEALANPDCGWFYRADASGFELIPGSPIAYWATAKLIEGFKKGSRLDQNGDPRQGLKTADNDRFLRLWHEVSHSCVQFECKSREEAIASRQKWFPYVKGGEFRKWYGNCDYVVNWQNDGLEIKENVMRRYPYLKTPDFVVKNQSYYFKESITWSVISSGRLALRHVPSGLIFDGTGSCIFTKTETLKYLQGFLNSSIALAYAKCLSPTLTFEVGQLAAYPIIFDVCKTNSVRSLVDEQRRLSKNDWDAFETSWDFKKHPLI